MCLWHADFVEKNANKINMKNMKKLEKTLKALANRRRLAILAYLKRLGEAKVGAVAQEIGLSIKATSRHLVLLSRAGIVEREQRGLEAFYSLADRQETVVECVASVL